MTHLMRQNTRHKLLVTLSDGRPDDYGDEYRGRYGIDRYDVLSAVHQVLAEAAGFGYARLACFDT